MPEPFDRYPEARPVAAIRELFEAQGFELPDPEPTTNGYVVAPQPTTTPAGSSGPVGRGETPEKAAEDAWHRFAKDRGLSAEGTGD